MIILDDLIIKEPQLRLEIGDPSSVTTDSGYVPSTALQAIIDRVTEKVQIQTNLYIPEGVQYPETPVVDARDNFKEFIYSVEEVKNELGFKSATLVGDAQIQRIINRAVNSNLVDRVTIPEFLINTPVPEANEPDERGIFSDMILSKQQLRQEIGNPYVSSLSDNTLQRIINRIVKGNLNNRVLKPRKLFSVPSVGTPVTDQRGDYAAHVYSASQLREEIGNPASDVLETDVLQNIINRNVSSLSLDSLLEQEARKFVLSGALSIAYPDVDLLDITTQEEANTDLRFYTIPGTYYPFPILVKDKQDIEYARADNLETVTAFSPYTRKRYTVRGKTLYASSMDSEYLRVWLLPRDSFIAFILGNSTFVSDVIDKLNSDILQEASNLLARRLEFEQQFDAEIERVNGLILQETNNALARRIEFEREFDAEVGRVNEIIINTTKQLIAERQQDYARVIELVTAANQEIITLATNLRNTMLQEGERIKQSEDI